MIRKVKVGDKIEESFSGCIGTVVSVHSHHILVDFKGVGSNLIREKYYMYYKPVSPETQEQEVV